MTDQAPELLPWTYGYQYHDCVRFNGGCEVNGERPSGSVPCYSQKQVDELRAEIERLRTRPTPAERPVLDPKSANPRMQCFECGRWMRLHGKRLEVVNGKITEVTVQRFYGGCNATGGDHPSGGDVCSRCCPDKCRERLASFPRDTGGSLAESSD